MESFLGGWGGAFKHLEDEIQFFYNLIIKISKQFFIGNQHVPETTIYLRTEAYEHMMT